MYGPQLGQTIVDLGAAHPLPLEQRGQLGLTDGCGFEQGGNLWVTLPMSNKVVAMIENLEGEIMLVPTNVSWSGDDMRDLYIKLDPQRLRRPRAFSDPERLARPSALSRWLRSGIVCGRAIDC